MSRGSNMRKHGMSRTPEYGVWKAMMGRCTNPKDHDFKSYGEKGISVCLSWHDFENFYADMGKRPAGMSLDRINNHLGYCKENCRWATWSEQNRNKSSNNWITHNGKTQCVADWGAEVGVNPATIARRIKHGIPIADALNPLWRKSGRSIGRKIKRYTTSSQQTGSQP